MEPTRILLVDDDQTSRMILRRLLAPQGYQVLEADSGEAALERFREDLPHVVLLDVVMPGIDGIQTAREMKAIAGGTYVPIFMLTALSDEKMLAYALEAGADDYIAKPYSRPVLEARLRAALRGRALFGELNSQKLRLEDLRAQTEREQETAARLLGGMFRSSALENSCVRFASTPLERFNGDLLLAGRTPGGAFRIMLGDFAGHGLTAAIGALPIAEAFQSSCQRGQPVETMLRDANLKLRSILPRDLFLAVCVVEVEPNKRTAAIWNAGMPTVFVRGARGGIKAEAPSRMIPLGVLTQLPGTEALVESLEPGDRLYLYSDGFIEANDPFQNEFTDALLRQLLAREGEGSRFDAVVAAHEAHVDGTPLSDDTTLVELTYLPQLFDLGAEPELVSRNHLELGAEALRGSDPMAILDAWLTGIPSIASQRTSIGTITTELLTNAIDHGLLGLDSRLKGGPGGFGVYYEERERRLAALTRGWVRLELGVESVGANYRLNLMVEDSGRGFDPRRLEPTPPEGQLFGRGLGLVRSLCRDLRVVSPGNRTEAVYEWSAADATRLPRTA